MISVCNVVCRYTIHNYEERHLTTAEILHRHGDLTPRCLTERLIVPLQTHELDKPELD
jgi:hypothetical protein